MKVWEPHVNMHEVKNMAKEENKVVGETEKIVFFGHYIVKCPYCNREIGIPQYRSQPVTLEDVQRQTRLEIKSLKPKKR